ncbi:MAG TPA: APC family permease [Vicinamibacterales bacterium]|jgi:amino acid transporter
MELRRVLRLRDLVAMNLVAVVSLRWITRAARLGPPSIVLWLLAWAAFFVPLGLAVSALASRFPEQGGIYAWTRRAFGRRHGFLCGWCLWINNLFYFPSLLLFAASNAAVAMNGPAAGGHETRTYSVVFVLVVLWLSTAINVIGLQVSKWVQNLGGIGTWLPAAVLVSFGALVFARFGSATSFAPHALLPASGGWDTLVAWSGICFAFSGFEVTAMVGQEVCQPRRTIPLGIFLGGIGATVIYIAGTASVLGAIPPSMLSERSGIADAIELVAGRIGVEGLGALIAAFVAVGVIAQTNSWVAASARVPFAAAMDDTLPRFFARLHARYRTPHVALLLQAALSSLALVASLFFQIGGSQTTLQDGYDILVNLTILAYFVPYLYLFGALLKLREPATDREQAEVRIPGGRSGLWLVACTGLLSTGISIAVLFVPPAGTGSALNYEVNLIGQTAVLLAIGLLLMRRRK